MLNQWVITRTVPMELRLRVAAPVRGERREQVCLIHKLTKQKLITSSSDVRFQALLRGTKLFPSRDRADERYVLLDLNHAELMKLGFDEVDVRFMLLAELGEKWSVARCELAQKLRAERRMQRWPYALGFA